jgi:sec-independent protein translocase protein TatA
MNIGIPFAFFGGMQEWLIVLLILVLLFGATKIPQLMRGIGRGYGELRTGLKEGRAPDKEGTQE